ncbi:MAG: riboflavin synthase [bacterium]
MFTGIIRELGTLREIVASPDGARLTVAAPQAVGSLVPGGSIAVDGTCLTVTALGSGTFSADVVPETLKRTRLEDLRVGAHVNLELPLRAGDFLDGHLVQGHVDGVGEVTAVERQGDQWWVTIRPGADLAPLLAEKGSVAVNGVSLTVAEAERETFSVALIPTTVEVTNLGELEPGSRVNLEVDVLARYVARLREMGS